MASLCAALFHHPVQCPKHKKLDLTRCASSQQAVNLTESAVLDVDRLSRAASKSVGDRGHDRNLIHRCLWREKLLTNKGSKWGDRDSMIDALKTDIDRNIPHSHVANMLSYTFGQYAASNFNPQLPQFA